MNSSWYWKSSEIGDVIGVISGLMTRDKQAALYAAWH
jgi:hypothetical protein